MELNQSSNEMEGRRKTHQKKENKDEKLLIMSNVVVFRQDSSRINSRFMFQSKFMFHCLVKARLQFTISKYKRDLFVKEYNRRYFNKNIWFIVLKNKNSAL